MKKILCLLILLALTTGVHADDKKKKKNDASDAPTKTSGGSGHAGGGVPGLPHGLGQTSGHSGASGAKSHSGQSMTAHAQSTKQSSNPLSQTGTKSDATGHHSNPLLQKGGQAGSTSHNSNPLTQGNQHTSAGKANPLTKKSTAQPGLNGHNGNALTGTNNANVNQKRGAVTQSAHGYYNRSGAQNWQHASHANYHVQPYREVYHNYHPYRHDRVWYTSHYDRVVVVGGGYYYWNAGYWYPAWGYDPAISFYAYDGPIYSYDNLPPDQVTMNVQTALQDQGYYTGEIDGQVGPKTRDALGAYQADHNLEGTSAVDEPTVESLGLAESS